MVLYSANLFFLGLLALCGANIATLVFARTAARDAEISVRTALGASRARIAGQLFAEALVSVDDRRGNRPDASSLRAAMGEAHRDARDGPTGSCSGGTTASTR